MMEVINHQKFLPSEHTYDAFDRFTQILGDKKDSPLPVKELKSFLQQMNQRFPSFSKIEKHFKHEFGKNTKEGNKLRWSKQDKQLLQWIVCKYIELKNPNVIWDEATFQLKKEEWKELAHITNLTQVCIEKQWKILQHISVRKMVWTDEEDKVINEMVSKFKKGQPEWSKVSDAIFQTTPTQFYRSPKQVRARWQNYLNPIIRKQEWSPLEDIALLQEAIELGKKWSSISQRIPGRNENQVKNRFKCLIRQYTEGAENEVVENENGGGEVLLKKIIAQIQRESAFRQQTDYHYQQHSSQELNIVLTGDLSQQQHSSGGGGMVIRKRERKQRKPYTKKNKQLAKDKGNQKGLLHKKIDKQKTKKANQQIIKKQQQKVVQKKIKYNKKYIKRTGRSFVVKQEEEEELFNVLPQEEQQQQNQPTEVEDKKIIINPHEQKAFLAQSIELNFNKSIDSNFFGFNDQNSQQNKSENKNNNNNIMHGTDDHEFWIEDFEISDYLNENQNKFIDLEENQFYF